MAKHETVEGISAALIEDVNAGASVFGIDGNDGSGKSTLANALSTRLGWSLISLDMFLEKNQTAYVANLSYEELRQAVASALRPIIIEGVCLLDAVERLGLRLDRHIYVKYLNAAGLWSDEEECDFDGSAQDIIARCEEDIQTMRALESCAIPEGLTPESCEMGLTPFRAELIRYHGKRKPARVAHHIYQRREFSCEDSLSTDQETS